MDPSARDALIQLLASWRSWPEERTWYLSNFVPRIVSLGPEAARNPAERRIIQALHDLLDAEDWHALGMLVAQVSKHADGEIVALRRNRQSQREQELSRWREDAEARVRAEREAIEAAQRETQGQERAARLAAEARVRAEQEAIEAAQREAEASRRESAAREAERQERQQRIERERAQARAKLLAQLNVVFKEQFVTARHWLADNDPTGLLGSSDFDAAAVSYVTEWCQQHLRAADGTPLKPDREQAAAIASVGTHALVAARAGSGKTATMVARAAFLVRGCGVEPQSILMLAFNVTAADEMRERLAVLLPEGHVPHVMTFHALAHRIVHPGENLLADLSDTRRALSKHVQAKVVDTFLADPNQQARVRDVMLAYFRKDWARIVARGDHLSPTDQVEYRRHLRDESIKGDVVKSYGEKLIANILFENGLNYGYEHDVRWNGRNYKPDFSIYDEKKKRRVVIEYFGMAGDTDYDKQSDEKRQYWASVDDVRFLEYSPGDVARPNFERQLLTDLSAAGAPLRRLSDDEIWERIKQRALDRFTDAATNLIARARQRRWTGSELQHQWNAYGHSDTDLDRFMELSAAVLDAYNESLHTHRKEDFTGLIWRAVDQVRQGATVFGRSGESEGDLRELEHIIVDEFQDFSEMFFELIQQVLAASPQAQVMAVGDDWQAINEFAGSTVKYFTDFEDGFPGATRLELTTNRRSAAILVALGNAVMEGYGAPAFPSQQHPGIIREFKADLFDPSPIEAGTFGPFDRTTPALLRLIQDHRSKNRSVAVLSRLRRVNFDVTVNGDTTRFSEIGQFGAHLRELLQIDEPEQLRFTSTHGFKGQEADAVILLDVTARNYPLIHPTWPLFQVFGDTVQSLTEAERRLFYVGVSRPRTHLDVLTTNQNPSDFWTSARARCRVATHEWDTLPEVRLGTGQAQMEIRVYNTQVENFDLSKDQLKRDDFRWRGTSKYWWRLVDDAHYDESRLLAATWAQHGGTRIEVWSDGRRVFEHRVQGGRNIWPPF